MFFNCYSYKNKQNKNFHCYHLYGTNSNPLSFHPEALNENGATAQICIDLSVYVLVCVCVKKCHFKLLSSATYKCGAFRLLCLWCRELLLMWEERNLGEISEGCFFKGAVAARAVERRKERKKNASPSVVIYHVSRYDGNDGNIEWARERRQ